MRRKGLLLCGGLAVLLLVQLTYVLGEEDNSWNRPATPVNPIQVDKPANWTKIGSAECPKECTTNGCCTAAWDQLGWQMLTMPKSNCSFCRNLRYALGSYEYSNKTEKCKQCLMDDFKTLVSNFKCNNDNGKCSKCCMDLTLIYLSRYVFSCPDPVWKRVALFDYRDSGFSYDGSSTCPAPPKRSGVIDPYDEEYFQSLEPNDPRRKIDWPKRVGERPRGQGKEMYVSYDYGYQEVNSLGIDMSGP